MSKIIKPNGDRRLIGQEFPDAFPHEVGIRDAKIQLHADGTITGDVDEFLKYVPRMKVADDPFSTMLVWLVVNAVKREREMAALKQLRPINNGDGAKH